MNANDPRNEPGLNNPRSFLAPENPLLANARPAADATNPLSFPSIQSAAPPIADNQPGWLSSLFGAEKPPIRAEQNLSYPDALDAHFARQFQQTYGDPVAVFDLPGAKTKKMSTDEVISKYRDITGRAFSSASASATTPEERDNIIKNWIAAQRSSVSALGFDPRVTIQTPHGGKLSLAGFYRPGTDTMWYNGDTQDAVVHESMHRGIEKLRQAGALPSNVQKEVDYLNSLGSGLGEEYLVRALKLRHFGEIEKQPGADTGNEQIETAKYFMNKAADKDIFNSALDSLESASSALIAKQHPKGPR